MSKFHVNPETGDAGECKATKSCPFGSASEHYETVEEAQSAAEEQLANEYGRVAAGARKTKKSNQSLSHSDINDIDTFSSEIQKRTDEAFPDLEREDFSNSPECLFDEDDLGGQDPEDFNNEVFHATQVIGNKGSHVDASTDPFNEYTLRVLEAYDRHPDGDVKLNGEKIRTRAALFAVASQRADEENTAEAKERLVDSFGASGYANHPTDTRNQSAVEAAAYREIVLDNHDRVDRRKATYEDIYSLEDRMNILRNQTDDRLKTEYHEYEDEDGNYAEEPVELYEYEKGSGRFEEFDSERIEDENWEDVYDALDTHRDDWESFNPKKRIF